MIKDEELHTGDTRALNNNERWNDKQSGELRRTSDTGTRTMINDWREIKIYVSGNENLVWKERKNCECRNEEKISENHVD
jgi:hypothetical protein